MADTTTTTLPTPPSPNLVQLLINNQIIDVNTDVSQIINPYLISVAKAVEAIILFNNANSADLAVRLAAAKTAGVAEAGMQSLIDEANQTRINGASLGASIRQLVRVEKDSSGKLTASVVFAPRSFLTSGQVGIESTRSAAAVEVNEVSLNLQILLGSQGKDAAATGQQNTAVADVVSAAILTGQFKPPAT